VTTERIAKTLAERSSEMIRARILSLAPGYEPGQRLYPNRLAEDLGVSPTPIREAFTLLAADGFVVLSPRRGATVFRPTEDEVHDLLKVQEWLELLATRLVSERITAGDREGAGASLLDACDGAIVMCEQAVESGDSAAYRSENTRFHRLLIAAGGNRQLTSLYETLLSRSELLSVYFPRLVQDVRRSVEEHRALLTALRQKNVAAAEDALREHWSASLERVSREYEEQPAIKDGKSRTWLPLGPRTHARRAKKK
jgi:DNA-binding GntR family transcriptional regulator